MIHEKLRYMLNSFVYFLIIYNLNESDTSAKHIVLYHICINRLTVSELFTVVFSEFNETIRASMLM